MMEYIRSAHFVRGENTPQVGKYVFIAVAERARAVIAGCDENKLLDELDTLLWMFEALDPDEKEFEYSDLDGPPKEKTPAAQLYNHRSIFNLDDANDLTWPQYFALYALLCVEQAWFMENLNRCGNVPEHYVELVPTTILMHAANAMEAVCYAEFLLQGTPTAEQVERQVRQTLSTRNAKAAYQRHAHSNRLKQQFIDFYATGEFPSKAEAARRFYRGLPEDRRNPTEENAVRMLSNALKEFERNRASR